MVDSCVCYVVSKFILPKIKMIVNAKSVTIKIKIVNFKATFLSILNEANSPYCHQKKLVGHRYKSSDTSPIY